MIKSQKEVEDKLKFKIGYHLKLSQIFASIFVGFGIMAFSVISTSTKTVFDIYDKAKTAQTQTDLEIIKMTFNILANLNNLSLFIFALFVIFFAISLANYLYAWHFKQKLDRLE